MRKRGLWALIAAVASVVLVVPSAYADQPTRNSANRAVDFHYVDARVQDGVLPIVGAEATARSFSSMSAAAAVEPTVGETRNWVGLDDKYGFYYRKGYTLRGLGAHAEVWVASELNRRAPASNALPRVGQSSGTNFLDGDCRNGVRTTVTDAQVNYLLGQFDANIWPKEAETFSIAPARDGSNALLPNPPFNSSGAGEKTVILVDNVRDDNFYDLNNTQGFSYIAGFFSSQLNDFFDRNVMTIDAFDWLHRTGATPPNEPVPGDNCTSAPARPFLYEGVFAHEYQHLLEHYEDGDEVNWINEGLSDWAEHLTDYVTPAKPITETGFDSHIQCFLGWLSVATPANPNPRATCGPENSLTRWGDQGDGEILADYGAAFTLMEFVHGRYGDGFMTALHRGDENGLAALQAGLSAVSPKLMAQDVLHDWSLMVALDGLIDDGMTISGNTKERDVTAPALDATINWDNPHAYSSPGAPSNGADYVRLRNSAGGYLSGDQVNSIGFQGSTTLPTLPVEWTVDANPPTAPGDPALYSGFGDNRDEAIVRQVTVPAGAGAVLTFDAFWNEELGWDFGFAQISTDGGSTYKSVACTDTTTEHNPDALPTAVENVPGFTGFSGTFKPQTCSLSAYAGQTVLLAFRAFNDPATLGESPDSDPGFWVDDVKVGSTLVSDGSSLAGWKSFTETKPNTVAGFTVTIVSIDTAKGKITLKRLPLASDFSIKKRGIIQQFVDKKADFVGAVVFYDDPSETSFQYAPYTLTVNGVTQPGGS